MASCRVSLSLSLSLSVSSYTSTHYIFKYIPLPFPPSPINPLLYPQDVSLYSSTTYTPGSYQQLPVHHQTAATLWQ
ncbi:hypothetical protein SNOG_02425 [Parastagonospora nodorum SN15]|uniref:Uncharacterized protein n=1 Tax=Phaeosphaeria nodorum (strain SN15 / ATCC MYA-4574 / FGSC 10173) TaxID=321614 RepID=Q0V0N9_PHANO|nr:hypothetical protein SNOG_02425 [Parastagonospora nodorum SN15]EAT90637.1 hypothetical protein SNOG_02425 [Parastagonospora nodorum SN15]